MKPQEVHLQANLYIIGPLSRFMHKFLVESPHTMHDCKLAVKLVQSAGYLNNFDWGCEAGIHTGWAVIEAENEAQALGVVPAVVRGKARAIKVSKFLPEVIDKWSKDE